MDPVVKPTHYDLSIQTHFPDHFTGAVAISIQILEPTQTLSINTSKSLRLHKIVLIQSSTLHHLLCSPLYDQDRELTRLKFDSCLKVGPAVLALTWEASLESLNLLGYYRIRSRKDNPPPPPTTTTTPSLTDDQVGVDPQHAVVEEKNGSITENAQEEEELQEEQQQQQYYAVTQFQPTSARRAFPCFDHPACKATFSVQLIVPDDYDALSNTGIKKQTNALVPNHDWHLSNNSLADFLGAKGKNLLKDTTLSHSHSYFSPSNFTHTSFSQKKSTTTWKVVEFETTPIMSTYLLAWAVGKFSGIKSSYLSPLTGKTIPLKLYASTSYGHVESGQGELALETLSRCMPLYERHFEIAYPLDKLDLLVCDEFDAGAMENYGLICGRTTNLLHDSNQSGLSARFTIMSTVAHEAAHMWFGNLVTMSWWDELWLNEGFATLIGELVIMNELEPDWQVEQMFIKFHTITGMDLDSLPSTHPVLLPCHDDSSQSITQAFDAISYEKGSSILNMLRRLIGSDQFITGTSAYLKKYAYGSATSQDLWDCLTHESGVYDVKDIMDQWINKVGYPVVIMEETELGLKLRQQRFSIFEHSNCQQEAAEVTIWKIPLQIGFVSEIPASPMTILFDSEEMTIPWTSDLKSRPFVLNAGGVGFFRTKYTDAHLARLGKEASKAKSPIPLADRLFLLQEVIFLAKAGYTRTSVMLEYIVNMKNEKEYLVWVEIAFAIQSLLDAWWEQPEPVLHGIKAFARSLFSPLVRNLGFTHQPEDNTDTRLFRVLVIAAAAVAEDESVLLQIGSWFHELASGRVDATVIDLAGTIICEGVKNGGYTEYSIALAIHHNPPSPQHKLAAIDGLAATRVPELLQQTAGMLLSGEVDQQNLTRLLCGLAANPCSRRMLWDLFQQAWPALDAQYHGSFNLGKLVQFSFQSLSNEEDAIAVEKFFQDVDTRAIDQALRQGLDNVRVKARWLARDQHDVRDWLVKNKCIASTDGTGA